MKKSKQNLDPSPLAELICPCGCENSFQPRRIDQIYLNSRHANHGYNHGKRKLRNPNKARILKIHGLNDSLLCKYFDLKPKEDYSFPLGIITAEGFDTRFHHGNVAIDGVTYFTSYHYRYTLWKSGSPNITYIKIEKHV